MFPPDNLTRRGFLVHAETIATGQSGSAQAMQLLPSAARAATVNGATQLGCQWSGVALILVVTANPGGGQTLSLNVRALPSSNVSVALINLGIMTTAANGTFVGIVAPGITPADYDGSVVVATAVANARIPVDWIAQVVHSGAGLWTYSLEAVPMF